MITILTATVLVTSRQAECDQGIKPVYRISDGHWNGSEVETSHGDRVIKKEGRRLQMMTVTDKQRPCNVAQVA